MTGLLIAVLVLIALVALGQRWAIWLGFVLSGLAVVGAFVNFYQPPAQEVAVLSAASAEDRRRANKLLRSREPVPASDRRLVEAVARSSLRTAGLTGWTGLILAGSQLDALASSGSVDVIRMIVLGAGIGLTALWLWIVRRCLAVIAHPEPDVA